jgi:hypothetical protein
MIARAASSHRSPLADPAIVSSTEANLVASSGSPITPVEARNTSEGLHPTASAVDLAVRSVASRPFLPVNALAFPELTTSARAWPPARFDRQKSTGADGHFDVVKTPATAAGWSNTISMTSVRFLYLIPAAAVSMRTPAIGGNCGIGFGSKWRNLSGHERFLEAAGFGC